MTMTDKCSSYRTREKRRYVYSRETGQIVDSVVNAVGYCVGTKECDECNCGGNEAMCDFYPEKRGKCESEMADYTKLCEDLRMSLERCEMCSLRHSCQKSIEPCKTARMSNAADAIEALQAECHNLQTHADYCESERDAYKDECERLRTERYAAVQYICSECKERFLLEEGTMLCNECQWYLGEDEMEKMTDSDRLRELILAIDLFLHGKQYRFEQESGSWYSRASTKEMSIDDMLGEIYEELSE